MEAPGYTPSQNFTPLQQDPADDLGDTMSIDDNQQAANIRLSQAQKFVLTKLMLPDATPLTSYEQTSGGRNIVANRDTLVKLGMVEVGENSANITERGKAALTQEGLMDDSGALTTQGEEYAFAADLNAVGNIAAKQKNELQAQGKGQPITTEPPMDSQMNDLPAPDASASSAMPNLEGWSMISDMQSELSESDFMRKHGKKL